MSIPFHPLAELFPPIEGDEFDDLVASIKANGLREAIVVHDGMVIDGRNRQRPCKAAGVDCIYEPLPSDADPLQFVLDKNLKRRHRNSRLPPAPCGRRTMSGRRSRDKGSRTERAIVRLLQDHALAAERVPLSGAARGRFGGDVSVPLLGRDMRVEVKARGNGFRELYKWLDGADLLVIRADRAEPLAIVPLKLAAEIAAAAEKGRQS